MNSTIFKIKFIIIIFFVCCSHLHAQNNIYVTDFNSDLYLIDIDNCSYNLIGHTIFTGDIAFNPINNQLYGIIGYKLYLIDVVTATPTLIGIGNPQINLNALTFSSNGILYAMGPLNDTLYTINPVSGTITTVGSTGTGLVSAGDLAFYRDTLYLAAAQNSLVAVDAVNPANSIVIGNILAPSPYGIATTLCPNILYSASDSGYIYKHSPFNILNSSLQCNLSLPSHILGAAAAQNIYVPADSVYANGCIFDNDTSLCEGQQLTLNATPFGSSYLWQDGNTNPIDTATNQGIYWVQAFDNGCFTTDSIEVNYISLNINVTDSSNTLIASEVGANYQWLDCSAMTPISGANNQSYSPTASGDYSVIITSNGCSDTSICQTVIVDGIMENDFGKGFKLFPNPTAGNFSIDLGETLQSVTITMTDLVGRVIISKTYHNTQSLKFKLDTASGVYLLIIESEEKKIAFKLIKN